MSTIYTPSRRAGQLMARQLRGIRALTWRLFVRELTTRYRQSVLGIGWAFVPPLFTLGMMLLLNRAGVIGAGDTGVPYPVFVVVGFTVWGLFSTTLTECVGSLVSAGAMISKIQFSLGALVLAKAGIGVVEFLIRVPLVIGAMVWMDVGVNPLGVALGALALVPLVVFTVGLGAVFAILAAVVRDLQFLVPLALGVLLLLTPVLYPVPAESLLGQLNTFNPMHHFIGAVRGLLLGIGAPGTGYWVSALAGAAVLALAWRLVSFAQPRIAERI